MEYRTELLFDKELAQQEFSAYMATIVPPEIYSPWDQDKEYASVPAEIKDGFLKLVERERSEPPGLTILGTPGVGKTKAVFALAQHLLKHYWLEEEMFSSEYLPLIIEHVEWVQMVRSSQYGDDKEMHRSDLESLVNYPGVLFIDDIGVSPLTDFISEQFYILVDRRLSKRRPTVFVTNANADELARGLDVRIAHRLMRWTRVLTYPKHA